jgi:hypothetical protein
LKKPAGSVRFRFYKQKTEKTKPNRNETDKNRKKNRAKTEPNRKNRAKTGKTEPNRFEPIFALKNRNRVKPTGFGSVFFFKKKIRFGYFF